MTNQGFNVNTQTSSTTNQNQFSFGVGNVVAPSLFNPLTSQDSAIVLPSAPPLSLLPTRVAVSTSAPTTNVSFGILSGAPLNVQPVVSSAPSSGAFGFQTVPSANVGLSTLSSTASNGLPPGNIPIQIGASAPLSLQSTVSQPATNFLVSQSLTSTNVNPTVSSQHAPFNSVQLSTRMAPLTHKDESLNQPIAQIVNDNLKDQKIERIYMHTLGLYRERGRSLRKALVSLSSPSARVQLMSQQNLESDQLLARLLEQDVMPEPVHVAVFNCESSLRELRTASSLLLTYVRRVADSLALLGADARYNAEALQLALRLREIPSGLASTMTGGQLDRQVAAYFSQLLDISQHEIRVAEELSERLEEEYQLHLQRNRQTAQENFPLNRFEGTNQTLTLEMLREALLAVASRIQCFKEAVQELIERTGAQLAAEVGDVIARKMMARATTATRFKSLACLSRKSTSSASTAETRRELLALEALDAERIRARHKSAACPFDESSTAAHIVAGLKGSRGAAPGASAEPRVRVAGVGPSASALSRASSADRSEPVVYVPVPLRAISGLTLPSLLPQTASPLHMTPSPVQGAFAPQRLGASPFALPAFGSSLAAAAYQPQAPQGFSHAGPTTQPLPLQPFAGFGAQVGAAQPSALLGASGFGAQGTASAAFGFGGCGLPTYQQQVPSGAPTAIASALNRNTNAQPAGVSSAPSLMVSSLLTPSLKLPMPSSTPSASSAGLLMMPTAGAPFSLKNPKQGTSVLAKRHQS